MFITGITYSQVETLGSAIVRIFDATVKVQVLNYDLPIPSARGILSIDYLNQEEVEISFCHKTIVIRSNPIHRIPFIPITPEIETSLPKQTTLENEKKRASVFRIQVTNPEIKEGLLYRVHVGNDKVFLVNATVSVDDRNCYVMVYNTSEKDIEIEVKPQELPPYETCNDNDHEENDILDEALKSAKPISSKSERVRMILERVEIKHLDRHSRRTVVVEHPYVSERQ